MNFEVVHQFSNCNRYTYTYFISICYFHQTFLRLYKCECVPCTLNLKSINLEFALFENLITVTVTRLGLHFPHICVMSGSFTQFLPILEQTVQGIQNQRQRQKQCVSFATCACQVTSTSIADSCMPTSTRKSCSYFLMVNSLGKRNNLCLRSILQLLFYTHFNRAAAAISSFS